MSKLAKFRKLSWFERRLFLYALALLPITALRLRLLGFRRTQQPIAASYFKDAAFEEATLIRAQQTARLVAAAARYGPYKASCLPISLTLQRLLRHQGIAADLRLGVSKAAARLDAHAWVEYRGTPLLENLDVHQRFAAFEIAFPPAAATPK